MASVRQYAGVDLESFLNSVYKGIEKHMGEKETVPITGKAVGKTPLLAQILALKKPYDDVELARNEVTRLINIRDAAEDKVAVFAEALEAGITSTWGTDPLVKAKYGVPPPKNRRELTVMEKLQKVAKSQETRHQRGTMGQRQKAKIKATGEVTVTTTVAAPPPAPGISNLDQPSGSGGVGSAPVSGGTNVVAAPPPAMGGAHPGGINVVTATPPSSGGTNVLAGAPAAGSGVGNVVAGGPPKAVDNSGLGGVAVSDAQNGAGH